MWVKIRLKPSILQPFRSRYIRINSVVEHIIANFGCVYYPSRNDRRDLFAERLLVRDFAVMYCFLEELRSCGMDAVGECVCLVAGRTRG